MDIGIATQPTYLKDLDIPGDKIEFGDLHSDSWLMKILKIIWRFKIGYVVLDIQNLEDQIYDYFKLDELVEKY